MSSVSLHRHETESQTGTNRTIGAYDLARMILQAAGANDAQTQIERLCYDLYPDKWASGRARAIELLNAWMPPASAGTGR